MYFELNIFDIFFITLTNGYIHIKILNNSLDVCLK